MGETRDSFRVRDCQSSDRHVQMIGNVAVFTHGVRTELEIGGEALTSQERETIVFERDGAGTWLAVHEHLSRAG
ncbi:hypothetical protein D3C87_1976560 [compost metagenome]